MKQKATLFFLLCAWAASVNASDLSLLGVGGSTSGDKGRRDDQGAFRSGLAVSFSQRSQGLDFGLEYQPTGEGKANLRAGFGQRYLLKVSVSRWRRFSDDSVYPDRTPLGTPVGSLYPYTNTLTPAFGPTSPVLNRDQLLVELTYGSPQQGLGLSFEAQRQNGDRTLQAGAFAFGEGASPAFFPASLGTLDARQWRGELSAWGKLWGWALSGRAGLGDGSSSVTARYPTYGAAELIGIFSLRTEDDSRFSWVQAAASREWQKTGLTLSAGLGKVENTPGFAGSESGGHLQPWLSAGQGEASYQTGALALWFKPWSWLTVGVSGQAREEEREASGHVGSELQALGSSRWERSFAGFVLSLRARLRSASAFVASSRKWEDSNYRYTFAVQKQREKRAAVKDWVRGELTWRPLESLRLRLRGDGRWEEHTLDLLEQALSYALGGRWDKWLRGRAEASWVKGPWELGLVGERMRLRQLWQAPLFDPVYDPSWELSPSPASVFSSQGLIRVAFAPEGDTVLWAEAGYRSQRWNLDAVVFPGFAPVDEYVAGWTGNVGAAFALTPADHLQFSANVDEPRKTVSHKLQRLELTFSHAFNPRLELFFRGLYRQFNETRFQGDDYQLKALALGLRGTF